MLGDGRHLRGGGYRDQRLDKLGRSRLHNRDSDVVVTHLLSRRHRIDGLYVSMHLFHAADGR